MKKVIVLIATVFLALFAAAVYADFGTNHAGSGIDVADSHSIVGLTLIMGTVFNNGERAPGATVLVMCNHSGIVSQVGETITESQGMYYVIIENTQIPICVAGDEAWILAGYSLDQMFESDHVIVQEDMFVDWADIIGDIGVPEYSTITLGAAVIVGCLGLTYLRRRK